MHELFEKLLPGPIVTDGAWGTQFALQGLKPGECPDAWNLDHPERVAGVARAYVESGSRVILTNTFGANRMRLEAFGLGERVGEINREGAVISCKAAGDGVLVFASMGPTGRMPTVDKSNTDELYDVFYEQAKALSDGGADALLLETFVDLAELLPALEAAKDTGLPVLASMVFDSGAAKDRTMMGTTPEQAAKNLADAGADALGANCGLGIEGYIPVCRRLKAAVAIPLWLKPNAGLPEVVDGLAVYHTTPETFAARTLDLVKEGADFVGGCCGTSPAYISAIVKALTV